MFTLKLLTQQNRHIHHMFASSKCYSLYCNMILLITIFLHIVVTNSLNINETTSKLKAILNEYEHLRNTRCVNVTNKLENFAENTVKFLEKTRQFGEYLNYYNVSDCDGRGSENIEYRTKHILNGFLISENVPDWHWDEYKSTYDKVFPSRAHELSALTAWLDNLKRVAQHNREYLAGKHSYSLHLNLFGDWPITTYMNRLLKLIKTVPLFDPAHDPSRITYRNNLHRRIPRSVDWRSKGFNPRREEQWQCGACYAFAVAHALQGQLYKKHKMWGELSPQQIVDCSARDGNLGCDGGSLQGALRYAARAGLIMETEYPYIGMRGLCHYSRLLVAVKPRRWATLPSGDEAAIERALATIGPLAVAVNAAPFTFQLYRSGIYDDPFCTPWKLNHAMLLVGYTQEYWVLLNWWGRQWGEDGYIRIRRGFNRCGVANMATYVEL
ncbi:cathepsin K-like [Epargyreus clarus]|uniref:cathepsin K-like n=1 Tax=Epargyreus clarus TaxID=520877 RepID=UPI003C30396B